MLAGMVRVLGLEDSEREEGKEQLIKSKERAGRNPKGPVFNSSFSENIFNIFLIKLMQNRKFAANIGKYKPPKTKVRRFQS